jgi:hypothetical protein
MLVTNKRGNVGRSSKFLAITHNHNNESDNYAINFTPFEQISRDMRD